METRFAETPQDPRDYGVKRIVWARDGDVVEMRCRSFEVVDSLCIEVPTAIAIDIVAAS